MSPYKNQVWMGFALCHLVLVALGASYVDLSRLGSLGKVLGYYSELSGAGSGYGFFAPGISGQLRVRFESNSQLGSNSGLGFIDGTVAERAASHEAILRLGNIVDQFPTDGLGEDAYDDPEIGVDADNRLKRSLASSLAVNMLKRHPEVKQLAVYLEEFSPVSMEEFRSGLRPQWTILYEVKFKEP
ncbi:MAG: hypothetical protein ABIQ95_04750 [Bdellovibrionia bacterium]